MIDLLLTDRELRDLTLYKQAKSQVRVLREWGIPFVVGRDGRPRVLRDHLKLISERNAIRREVGPNLEGLDRR